MRHSVSKISIALLIAATSTSLAYAAIRSTPLDAKKAISYISRMLANPNDATDGTVKRAVSLTQSCKAGEVMQGFGANGNIICVSQIQNPGTKTTENQKQQGFWCSILGDNKENNAEYNMLCNSRTWKICTYYAYNDVTSWQWSCDAPKGFSVSEKEYVNCSTVMRMGPSSNFQQYSYTVSCISDLGKICTYMTLTDANGNLQPSEWKCQNMRKPDSVSEFRQ